VTPGLGIEGIAWLIHVFAAVGVTWLGWQLYRLSDAVTSMADMPGPDNAPDTAVHSGRKDTGYKLLVNRMAEAIRVRFEDTDRVNSSLKDQVKELNIQVQLCQRRERNAEAIIYSIRDAVVVVDEYDKLLMANESAGKLFGFDHRDSQYKPIDSLIETDKEEFATFVSQCRQSKARATRREIEISKDGILRTYDTMVSCVYDHAEKVCGVVGILHDITREKEISQMKNDFVSHVSHELKTPLASITAYSEMLVDGEASDEDTRKEFYSVIQNQAERLNRLIEDILNTSRIESGLIKVDKQTLSLPLLLDEQVQMIKGFAAEKNIGVSWRHEDAESKGGGVIVFGQVNADKDMLSQVIVNLLSNAVKYTPNGGTVKVEMDIDEKADMARVSVSDTGVGIPEDNLERVFDKFYRVKANNGQAKGTGLGLNLVKQIIEKVHGGRVFVKSKVGQGSTFGFELPLATAEVVKS
jgi:two-component system phosphate regulon sensor histidine kinase PhoR